MAIFTTKIHDFGRQPRNEKYLNKNARRPKEAHIAQNLKEIEIVDRAGEDLKDLDQHQRFWDELKEMKKSSK